MRRWYLWVLAPVMLGSAWIIAVLSEPPTLVGQFVAYGLAATLILAILAMADPSRFSSAVRLVAGAILLAYAVYSGNEFLEFLGGKPFGWAGSRGEPSLRNALIGLVVFGIPAGFVAFARRASAEPEPPVERDEAAGF